MMGTGSLYSLSINAAHKRCLPVIFYADGLCALKNLLITLRSSVSFLYAVTAASQTSLKLSSSRSFELFMGGCGILKFLLSILSFRSFIKSLKYVEPSLMVHIDVSSGKLGVNSRYLINISSGHLRFVFPFFSRCSCWIAQSSLQTSWTAK